MSIQPIQSPHSRAVMERTLELRSLQAQKVMNRSFDKLRQSLFSVSVILRITYSDDEVDSVEQFISSQFEQLENDANSEIERILKILEDNGVSSLAHYSKPTLFKVSIDTPAINRFLNLVSLLDDLMLHIDSAWLNGELDDKQKKNASFTWQQRLIKLAGRIIHLENQTRRAAIANGKEAEVNEAAPADNSDTSNDLKDAVNQSEAETLPENLPIAS